MDVICYEDLDLFGRETDDELIALEQDVYHILVEDKGTNLDNVSRGLGLANILSGPFDPTIKERMIAELLKDDRIANLDVAIQDFGNGRYQVDLAVEPIGSISVLVGPEGVTRA